MAAPILSFVPTKSEIEKPKEPTFPPQHGCYISHQYRQMIQERMTKKVCPHCGAAERLITGECAYCRQY